MAEQVIMPKLGLNMTEGILLNWLVEDGNKVNRGEAIFELETEKVTNEAEAKSDGILRHAAQPGDVIPVGGLVGYILQPGEEMPGFTESPDRGAIHEPEIQASEGGNSGQSTSQDILAREGGPGSTDVLASPAAKRMAKKLGVDMSRIKPSQGNQISIGDVEEYAKAEATGQEKIQPENGVHREIRLGGIRATIARRMLESTQNTAPVTLTTELDATELVAFHSRLNKLDEKVSYNAILLHLTARALADYPTVNARFGDQKLQIMKDVNIGFAVDTERGLLVPVIRNADVKTPSQIEDEIQVKVKKARAGKLDAGEMSGGTFTITNLGMYEIDTFTPIINVPETAVLGIGRILQKPAVHGARIEIRHHMYLSLTFDHRAIDGAPAARFLQRVKGLIETID
jgi:pyruvate dehydrogenase E2 component (dihydrolipoamide acetyltransferase)